MDNILEGLRSELQREDIKEEAREKREKSSSPSPTKDLLEQQHQYDLYNNSFWGDKRKQRVEP